MSYNKTGDRIVQSRIWEDPNEKTPPSNNYVDTYPITVYQAVRESFDENSETLCCRLNDIEARLAKKQNVVPDLSPDHIITYGGEEGVIGSIQITTKIVAALDEESNDRIPTERAVGELLRSLGLVTNEGGVTGNIGEKVLWDAIVDRPIIYQGLEENSERDLVSQAGLKKLFDELNGKVNPIVEGNIVDLLSAHLANKENPHEVTLEQLNAASADDLQKHVEDTESNPHHVTKEQLGLSNVDDTSDDNKPVSKATKAELEKLQQLIETLSGSINGLSYITSISYSQDRGLWTIEMNDGTTHTIQMAINELIHTIEYVKETNSLQITTLGGKVTSISLSDIFEGYFGLEGPQIDITVDGNGNITASLKEGSITDKFLAANSVTTEKINSEAVTSDKLAEKAVTAEKIDDNAVTNRSLDNYAVTSEKIADGGVGTINIADQAVTSDKIKDNAVKGDKLVDGSIGTAKLAEGSVTTDILAEDAVTSKNIAPRTVGTSKLRNDAVVTKKIADDAVTSEKIAEGVELRKAKLAESPDHDRINNKLIPDIEWVLQELSTHKFTVDNLSDGGIPTSKLESDEEGHKVLAVVDPNSDPQWTLVDDKMLGENSVSTANIKDANITKEKMALDSVGTEQIEASAVTSEEIAEGAVTKEKIFAGPEPFKVLATGNEAGHPDYTEVTKEMLAKSSVDTEKLVDGSVTLDKLTHPENNDNVVILYDEEEQTPKFGKIEGKYIEDYSIPFNKLPLPTEGGVVLGSRQENVKPEYIKITEDMLDPNFKLDQEQHLPDLLIKGKNIDPNAITSDKINDGAVTTSKIQDGAVTLSKLSIPLPEEGSASDVVLAILESGQELTYSKITPGMIPNKTVGAEKLFTSDHEHSVLLVDTVGSDPKYGKVGEEYIEDGAVSTSKLGENLELKGQPTIGTKPEATDSSDKIASTMWVRELLASAGVNGVGDVTVSAPLSQDSVTTDTITDQAVTTEKIKKGAVSTDIIADEAITSKKIATRSVGTTKLRNDAVTTKKIKDGSVTSEKLSDELVLPSNTKASNSPLEEDHVRNMMISRELPTNPYEGQIVLLY